MKCERCRKETPDNIPNCIHCGYIFKKSKNTLLTNNNIPKIKKDPFEIQKKLQEERKEKQKQQNRIIAIVILAVFIIISLSICIGLVCSSSKTNSKSEYIVAPTESITRAEWITELSLHYGMENCVEQNPFFNDVNPNDDCFKAVQYSTEWGILDEDLGYFEPEKACTNSFAIVTAVKSVDMDLINSTKEGKNVDTDEEIINYFNQMSGVNVDANLYLDRNTLEQILIGIDTIRNNLVFENSTEIKLKNNVKQINSNAISNDTGKSLVLNEMSVKNNDILLVEACNEYPSGKAVKVTNAKSENIEYVEADISEVFKELDIIGNFAPELLGAEIESSDYEVDLITNPDDMTFDDKKDVVVSYLGSPESYNNSPVDFERNVNVGDVWVNLKSKLDKNLSLDGKLCLADCTINLQLKTDSKGIKRASVSLRTTAKLQISLSAKKELDIPTVKLPFKIFGIVGGEIDVNIKVGISGSVTFSISCDCNLGCSYKRGCMPKYPKPITNPDADSDFKVSGYVKAETVLFAALINKDLFDVGFETGFVGEGKNNDYDCIDLDLYWTFEAFINSDKSLLADLGIKVAWTIFDKENTPLKWNWHIEDGKVVDKCTKGKTNTSEKNESNTEPSKKVGDYTEAAYELIYNFPKYGLEFTDTSISIELIDLDADNIPEILYCSHLGSTGIPSFGKVFKYNGEKYIEGKMSFDDGAEFADFPILPKRNSSNELFFVSDIRSNNYFEEYPERSDFASFWYYHAKGIVEYRFSDNELTTTTTLADYTSIMDRIQNDDLDDIARDEAWEEYKEEVIKFNNEYSLDDDYKYTIAWGIGTGYIDNKLPIKERLDLYHQTVTREATEFIIEEYQNHISEFSFDDYFKCAY